MPLDNNILESSDTTPHPHPWSPVIRDCGVAWFGVSAFLEDAFCVCSAAVRLVLLGPAVLPNSCGVYTPLQHLATPSAFPDELHVSKRVIGVHPPIPCEKGELVDPPGPALGLTFIFNIQLFGGNGVLNSAILAQNGLFW